MTGAECVRIFNTVIGLEIVALFVFLVPAALRWWYADKENLAFWSVARLPTLILSCVLIMTLFSARPVDLTNPPKADSIKPAARDGLVQIELKKANDEIQYRIQQEDTWFHYKFLFVGGLLAGFFTIFQIAAKSRSSLVEIAGSTTTCFVMAMACIVAIAIDIHLRNNIVVIQQLALWITHYAEPALASTTGSGFLAWEQFLRTEGTGMHSDELYGFLFYPHLHFLTWVLYMLYLSCFHWIAIKPRMPARHAEEILIGVGFVFVHFALAALAFVGHFVPGTLRMKAIPLTDCWENGISAATFYLLAALLLVSVNSPYLVRFLCARRFRALK